MKNNIVINNWKIIFQNNSWNFSFFDWDIEFYSKKNNKENIDIKDLNSVIRKARIEITLKCNMACKYCIVYKNFIEQINNHMSLDNAKKVLDKINSYKTIDSLMIIWWEPLTNIESLRFLCENFKGKKSIFTNWYLLTPELVNFFSNNNSRLMISLDGKKIHNINRVNHKWEETFDIIIEKIKIIKDSLWDVTLNTLVTNNSVSDLFDVVKYFVEDLKITSFWLSYPHYTKENIEFAKDFDYKEYTRQMKLIFNYSKENWIYVNQLKNILKYLLNWKIKKYACKIVWEQITFYPDWRQTFCTKLDTLDKKITPYDIKKKLPILWNYNCDICIAKTICWWWCPWDNEFDKSNFDERMCYFNKELTKYILTDIYKEALKIYKSWWNIEKWLEKIYCKMLQK